jgi:hypothetical protein
VLFLELILSGYVLFLIIVGFLALSIIPRGARTTFFKLGALVPFVAVVAVFKTVFAGAANEDAKQLRFRPQLASIEDRIESKRVEIFGGKRLDPSISSVWHLAHMLSIEQTMRDTVKMSKKIVGIETPAHTH